jgi:hypothetical protein
MMCGEDQDQNKPEITACGLHKRDSVDSNQDQQQDSFRVPAPPPCAPSFGNGTSIDWNERRYAKNRIAAKNRRDRNRQKLSDLGEEHGRVSSVNKLLLVENAELANNISQLKLILALQNENIKRSIVAANLLPLTGTSGALSDSRRTPVPVGHPILSVGGPRRDLVNYDATEHSKHALLHHGHYLQNTSSNYQHARPASFPASASGDHTSSWTLAAYNRQNQLRDQIPTLQQQATNDDISRMSAMLALAQQQAQSASLNGKPSNAEATGNNILVAAAHHGLSRMEDDELIQMARAELASLQHQQSNTSRNGIRFQDPPSLNQAFRNHRDIAGNIETSTNNASRLLLASSVAQQQMRRDSQAGIPPAMAFQQQERRREAIGCAIFPRQEEYQQNAGLYEAYLLQQRQQTMRVPASLAAAADNHEISPFFDRRALPMASSLSTGSQLQSQQGILRRMHTAANNSVGRNHPNNQSW